MWNKGFKLEIIKMSDYLNLLFVGIYEPRKACEPLWIASSNAIVQCGYEGDEITAYCEGEDGMAFEFTTTCLSNRSWSENPCHRKF